MGLCKIYLFEQKVKDKESSNIKMAMYLEGYFRIRKKLMERLNFPVETRTLGNFKMS